MLARHLAGRQQLVALNTVDHARYVAMYDGLLMRVLKATACCLECSAVRRTAAGWQALLSRAVW